VWGNVGTSSEQLNAIIRRDADVAIAAIVMTPEPEQTVDFSTSYFNSVGPRAERRASLHATISITPRHP
jgi:hypothetical protein